MWLPVLVTYLLLSLQAVFAAPPPEHSRVLVVVDDTNDDITASGVSDPLRQRGFDVTVASVKDHPHLVQYGERSVDSVLIVPGKTKALGSTLRAGNLLEFMQLGGNIVALTTPKFSPAALREVAAQVGINISGRGIESRNAFGREAVFPHSPIVGDVESLDSASLFSGSAVAKLSENNPFTLGLIQAPYSAYSYNAAKESSDDSGSGEPLRPLADSFALGSDMFVSAALQSLHGSRFVWVGSSQLLTDAATAESITSWAFQERGKLRVVNSTHTSLRTGESHLHYSVEEPLRYCAQIEQWVPELKGWIPYENVDDVQLEFKMLDPFYRLNLGKDGCVEFVSPDQYGMFTFQLDYKRPGMTFLDEKKVVTVRHRANDEWDRSWTITNSWVYLSGVSTTVIGFVLFVIIYLSTPELEATAPSQAAPSEKASQEKTSKDSTETKDSKEPKDSKVVKDESKKSRRKTKN